jgi:phosphate-selective porin OprO/OprP
MMQERPSALDGMMPSRNVGIVLNGTIPSERVSYAVGIFNDWFDAGEKLSESATQIVGRVTGLPYLSGTGTSLLHLGFGVRHTDAKQGMRFRTEPEFNLAPDFVDTGLFEADRAVTYDFEFSAVRGPMWLASEFVRTDVRSPSVGDPTFSGYHVAAYWTLTGEARSYNKRGGVVSRYPIAKPVNQGGWGAWEVGARVSHLDLTDGGIEGGELDVVSLGFNWWLTPVWVVSANYRHVTLDRFGVVGRSDGVLARIILMLE